jgi:hypothetical protein
MPHSQQFPLAEKRRSICFWWARADLDQSSERFRGSMSGMDVVVGFRNRSPLWDLIGIGIVNMITDGLCK